MVWLLLFTLLITCGFWCRRRHRYRTEYILVRSPDSFTHVPTGTVYGSVEGPIAYNAAAVGASVPTAPMVSHILNA